MIRRHCNAAAALLTARPARKWYHSLLPCLLLPGVLLLFSIPVAAIVIRHDRSDRSYVVDAASYPASFHLHTRGGRKVCLATLISPRWALTAGHCVDDTPVRRTVEANERYQVHLNAETYDIVQLVLHPQYSNGSFLQGVDLALVQLDRAVTAVIPVPLNRTQDEVNRVVTLLGWGYTGIGSSERRFNDGKFRRAENTVDTAERWLMLNFDDPTVPDSTALQLEGVPGLGDSGGPALLAADNGMHLAGIAIGELEANTGSVGQGRYGATEVYERISLHLEWIESIIGTH